MSAITTAVVTLKIDGVDISASNDQTILEVARENKIDIPHPLPARRFVGLGRLPFVPC